MAKQKDKQNKKKKKEILKNIKESKFFYDKVKKAQIKKNVYVFENCFSEKHL